MDRRAILAACGLAAIGLRRQAQGSNGSVRRFVSEGRDARSPWDDLKRQVYVGDEALGDTLLARIDDEKPLADIPETQHRSPPKPLDHYAKANPDRDTAILATYRSGG